MAVRKGRVVEIDAGRVQEHSRKAAAVNVKVVGVSAAVIVAVVDGTEAVDVFHTECVVEVNVALHVKLDLFRLKITLHRTTHALYIALRRSEHLAEFGLESCTEHGSDESCVAAVAVVVRVGAELYCGSGVVDKADFGQALQQVLLTIAQVLHALHRQRVLLAKTVASGLISSSGNVRDLK